MGKLPQTGAATGTPFIPTDGSGGASSNPLMDILGTMMPEKGSQAQRDLVLSALQGANSSAQDSGSPLLAFLAPMATGAIGTRTENAYQAAEATRRQEGLDKLLAALGGSGGGGSPSFSGVENAKTLPASRAPLSYGSLEVSASPRDRELLARTLMAEAGGEGAQGMLAAGSVIANRVNADGYGDNFEQVIMAPGQFSAWNLATGYAGGEGGLDMEAMTPSAEAYAVSDAILSGNYSDPTGGATHYYNPAAANPEWGASAGGDWTKIGNHVFGNADGGAGLAGIPYGMGGGGMTLNRDLLELMIDPNTPEDLRGIAGTIFEAQLGGTDPMKAINLQKGQIELAKLLNPGPRKGERVGDNLVDPYTGKVIYEGPADPSRRRTIKGADGYTYYEDDGSRVLPGVTKAPENNADNDRQLNVAAEALNGRVDTLQTQFNPATGDLYTREEAIAATRRDPLYSRQWEIVDRAQGGTSSGTGGAAAPAPQATPSMPSDPAPTGPGGVAAPRSKKEYDALPSGARFVDPEGTVRIKP